MNILQAPMVMHKVNSYEAIGMVSSLHFSKLRGEPWTNHHTTEKINENVQRGLGWFAWTVTGLVGKCAADSANPLSPVKSFRACNSFKPAHSDSMNSAGIGLIPEDNWDAIVHKKRRSSSVRIASKRRLGFFIRYGCEEAWRSIFRTWRYRLWALVLWATLETRDQYQSACPYTKSPSASYVLAYLHAKKMANPDVQEIHCRTPFGTGSSMALPQTILDHERIFWFGDLNYRINLWKYT